jgi:hypothetical protein
MRQKILPTCRAGSEQVVLGLVAEALLVAIRLHALATLVLADLGLPTLLEVAHGLVGSGCFLRGLNAAIP